MVGFSPPNSIVNRVLLVESDRDEADFLRSFLQKRGLDVDVAKDGGQAHASFSMRQPDIVILELLLPNASGFEVCEQLKRINNSVPIIVLTAIDMEDARELARRVGADDYLTKPYDPEELLTRMQQNADAIWARIHFGHGSGGGGGGGAEEKVRFECPDCGKRLKASSTHRGRTLNCPRCGQPVIVPRHA